MSTLDANQRAKLTRNLGKTASNFDHPRCYVTIQLLSWRFWSVMRGNNRKDPSKAFDTG